MQRLLIVGAGSFGRAIWGWAMHVDRAARDWEVGGFLDGNPMALNNFNCPLRIVGDPLTFIPSDNDRLICAIGNPATKLRLCRDLKARGAQFITLIHPTVVIGPECRIGNGSILCPGAIISTNATLGEFVTVNLYATVGEDAVIGDGCILNGHCDVTGSTILGEGVFVGSHASVLPGTSVGEYAVLGAGSVILRKVRAHSTVLGVPAKQVYGFEQSSSSTL